MKRFVFLSFALFFICTNTLLFSQPAFSGFAGGKIDFRGDPSSSGFEPDLEVQAFFAGKVNLSKNIILRAEFSITTTNLIDNSIFKEAPSFFKIDELSLVFRHFLPRSTNYFSIFIGDYEPIGSDVFLQRQFGMQKITSKITENWLGLSGSVVYPLFGVGGAYIIHMNDVPIATGPYIYVNHELDDCYVFNAAYRFACLLRFFAFDFTLGLGVPLVNTDDDAYITINRLYLRGGFNLLLGNAKTTSLFVQGGLSDIGLDQEHPDFELDVEKSYLLFEPRFRGRKCSVDLTLFSLPADTIKQFIYIEDTLGFNINVYTDNLYIKNKIFLFGINTALSFPDRHINDLGEISSLFDDYSIILSPYFETKIYNGNLNMMLELNIKRFMDGDGEKGFKISLGYKTQL